MSIWTHVSGVIRLDSLRVVYDITPEINKCFKPVRFEDPIKMWEKCNMPRGSEGSLQYMVQENPDESTIASHIVVIYGDLRDYGIDRETEIVTWWRKVLKQMNSLRGCVGVRNAVLSAKFEDGSTVVLDEGGKRMIVQK